MATEGERSKEKEKDLLDYEQRNGEEKQEARYFDPHAVYRRRTYLCQHIANTNTNTNGSVDVSYRISMDC